MNEVSPTPDTPNETAPQDSIKDLCEKLAKSLYNSPGDYGVLDEQVQILNSLFHATLAAQLDLGKNRYGYENAHGWLELAWKIQKQCTDTVRTQQAIEYMHGLTTINANKLAAPAPTPPLENEQTK